jgi:hypothetical protein
METVLGEPLVLHRLVNHCRVGVATSDELLGCNVGEHKFIFKRITTTELLSIAYINAIIRALHSHSVVKWLNACTLA